MEFPTYSYKIAPRKFTITITIYLKEKAVNVIKNPVSMSNFHIISVGLHHHSFPQNTKVDL